MEITAKTFSELTTMELFEILKARSAVFVVEQNCIYQDMNDLDLQSIHVCLRDGGTLKAYLRAFIKDPETKTAQIGRVLTLERGAGYGMEILKRGIQECRDTLGAEAIFIESQCYATGFYEKEGFQICSEPFLDDGIPHVEMILK